MAASYQAIFSPSPLPIGDVLDVLEEVFQETGIEFEGSLARLKSNLQLDIAPILAGDADLESGKRVDGMKEAKSEAAAWPGVSLACISRSLLEQLGRGDSMEVYFSIGRDARGHTKLVYEETRAAFRKRQTDPELARELFKMLLAICERLKIEACVYDQAPMYEEYSPDRTVVEQILVTGRFPSGGSHGCIVFAQSLLSVEDARRLEASWSEKIKLATNGYGLACFMADQE